MILPSALGLSLVILASTGPTGDVASRARQLSNEQRNSALQPVIGRATECVAKKVTADPRFEKLTDKDGIEDLIVESMPACAALMRTMIETYNLYFGEGSGEAFFNGPYLDFLPGAVRRFAK
jgi:hypothetical protein